jgi:uncharacterized protein (TIGR02271 family)
MNNANQITLAGVFQDYSAAEQVVRELKSAGFSDNEIHLTHGTENVDYRDERREHVEDETGIAGFFRRMFGSDDDSTHYERAVQSGRAVVTVDADQTRMDRAIDIMNRNNALQVERDDDTTTADTASRRMYDERRSLDDRKGFEERNLREGESIPVIQEELQVGKRVVNRGGVRVYSRVVDQPVEEKVTLREERVRVDRRPVDRTVSAQDTSELRDQTIEVLETAEEPVVSKRARVVEEVTVGKDTTERTDTIRDNVRRTEVEVENLGKAGTNTTTGSRMMDDSEFRNDFNARYASRGEAYDVYAPAYQYGYTAASDPRWRGRSWSDVESDLQSDYARTYPNSTWENIRGAVRYGWEKITGRHSAA